MSRPILTSMESITDRPHPFIASHHDPSYTHWKRPLTKTYGYNMDVQEYYYKPQVDFLHRKDINDIKNEQPPGAQSFEERCVSYWPGQKPRLHTHENAKQSYKTYLNETNKNVKHETTDDNEEIKFIKPDSEVNSNHFSENSKFENFSKSNKKCKENYYSTDKIYPICKSASNLEMGVNTKNRIYKNLTLPPSTMQNPFATSCTYSGIHWKKPLTKVYDYNMDVQEYYYKPHVDYLFKKDYHNSIDDNPPGPQTFAERCINYWPGMKPRILINPDVEMQIDNIIAQSKNEHKANDEECSKQFKNTENDQNNSKIADNKCGTADKTSVNCTDDINDENEVHLNSFKENIKIQNIKHKEKSQLMPSFNSSKNEINPFRNNFDIALDKKIDILRERLIIAKKKVEEIIKRWPQKKSTQNKTSIK